jgi:cyclic beta-1,2-glucan synthetase
MSTTSAEAAAAARPAPSVSAHFFTDSTGSDPIRAELFGLEHLESHGQAVAASCTALPGERAGHPLLDRFTDNGRVLEQVHRRIIEATHRDQSITPDAEWLLDNFHIVSETLQEVRHDLPRGYYKRLPKLAFGPLAGYPRVYALALELIAHTDSSLDEANLTRFVEGFQSRTPLRIGELWGVPIMLRLGLLENLRRLAEQMLRNWAAREAAEACASHLLTMQSQVREWSEAALSEALACWPQHASDAFVVRLLRHLRDQGPTTSPLIESLENHFAARGINLAEVVRRENQRQAADQVSVGNCVTSLRLLSALDWTVFFERTSWVERTLREDPADVYARQDFATKDNCRRTVEKLARGSGQDELVVARRAVAFARHCATVSGPARQQHVGFYIWDRGRRALEADLGYRPALYDRMVESLLTHSRTVYFGTVALVYAAMLAGVAAYSGLGGWSLASIALVVAALLPLSDLAVGVVHYLVTLIVPPRVLPKLDFKEGISESCATFVVMPTMLLRPESADSLIDRLEVHYLSNPDSRLYFALLTDFADAPVETMPEDQEYLRTALEQVRVLNERYCPDGQDRFFVFHRRRQWNPAQSCWMGWERKRGKLAEFNRLLRGAQDTSFAWQSGDLSGLPHFRFVITLDADTQLPRETAQRLVGTLAHPLNRPRFDRERGRVIEGYGVLQPRVSLNMIAATRSLFARIFASSAGIDPYTTAVSDVYMDLFGEGTFTGKGIYDIDAFEEALGQTFPDNRILSHDLIEGNYARCGLVTDIELLDDFPARYHAYSRREHRWIRGDWQLLPWLFRKVPVRLVSRRVTNAVGLVERWKILDNLRRSLVPPALVALLVLGWLLPVGTCWFYTALAVAALVLPLLLLLPASLWRFVRAGGGHLQVRELGRTLGPTAGQVLLTLIFLAEQARVCLDAILRTLFRLGMTRRNLLEWETAATTDRRLGGGFFHFCLVMWLPPLFAVSVTALVVSLRPETLIPAGPILLAWFVSPVVAFRVSQPRRIREAPLNPAERAELRRIARKTWSFFETFIGPEDNWLPPDNFQQDPKGAVAHRTSPTNIGLYLLSTLAARDFGYLTVSAMLDRLENAFASLDRLERYRGHFLNWYDTSTLEPLQPKYISTVDSGNLLACFVALQQGLQEQLAKPSAFHAPQEGLRDTLSLAAEEFRALEPPVSAEPLGVFQSVEQDIETLCRELQTTSEDPGAWGSLLERLRMHCTELRNHLRALAVAVGDTPVALERWSARLAEQIENLQVESKASVDLQDRCRKLIERANTIGRAMDFALLYNKQRQLFSIGYNLSLNRLDNAHYDLLASEACLTSFLAIARGDAPTRHWFQLGRQLTSADGRVTLLSWGGTMFEYLMPRLLLPTFPETLLAESWGSAVDRQIDYGQIERVPWGISESGFYAFDASLNYQYQAFGVPGMGLKRGLGQTLVIAPYATALALPVRPHAALENFRRLKNEQVEGDYGFYEAVDYTRDRLTDKRRPAVVRSYMAHHQGMSFVALANCLLGDRMVRRFHAEPMVRATELLLQEKVPLTAPLLEPHADESTPAPMREKRLPLSRRLATPHTPSPRAHLLSNGRYSVLITNAGSGRSTWRDLDVVRWREDRTCDPYGQFCYIRDLRTGALWSAGHQPIGRDADDYEVVYSSDKAEIRRLDAGVETHLEIAVSPESAAEVRRLTFTNHNHHTHELEVTSYAEIVLSPHGSDLAHPAFGKLFLETEFLPGQSAVLCRRRPRSADQKPMWAVHVVAVERRAVGGLQYETDRSHFLGRGRTTANPQALDRGASLTGTTGPVLDPIFSLRCRARLAPGAAVSVAFTTAVAETREEAVALADHFHDFHGVARAFELAWAHSQVVLRHLHLTTEGVHLYQRLAAHLLYVGTLLRDVQALAANRQGQAGLWRHGISGDLPILLVRVSDTNEMPLVERLLEAHAYWRLAGLSVDLVILNEHATSYYEELHEQLQALIRGSESRAWTDKPGGVFLRKAAHLSEDDRLLLRAAARVVLVGNQGSLASQLERSERIAVLPPLLSVEKPGRIRRRQELADALRLPAQELLFSNGLGGFTADGREYWVTFGRGDAGAIQTPPNLLPPAPWINVISNPSFGFLVSESGAGYTWAGNSQLNRLTPWNNDPVSDPPGEVIYVRDETTGEFWTPTPLPCGVASPSTDLDVRVRHGQGYTIFEQVSHGIEQELLLFVPVRDPVKILRLRLRNRSDRVRRLSATFYAEWVLGTVRDQAALQVVCEVAGERPSVEGPAGSGDPRRAPDGPLLARNAFRPDFGSRVSFADVSLRPRSYTADRAEFLGRNGCSAAPAALTRIELSGNVEPGADPCAALMGKLDLSPGEQKDVVFFLGEADNVEEIERVLGRYRTSEGIEAACMEVRRYWDELLSAVQVRTPDPAMDVLLNRWLLYQVLSCRVWGRSAFYQSGGAYGFRDQLQDVMALVHAAPHEQRAQILRAASRQFLEGDVQHWWHPPAGRGVRTRISDDYLWLPLVTCHYVSHTGNTDLLDERAPFLRAPVLRPEQEEDYGQPEITTETATIYEHCVRALNHGLRFGSHGLPLMGTGDWNDGMNRVGPAGRGESVWNGWFLLTILSQFATLAENRKDVERTRRYREEAERLQVALEEHAWDGGWYRRAYFDDGTPLGSVQNDECKIDSIPQTWAVISGAANPERTSQAMKAVEESLVRQIDKLILLFAPPFDRGTLEPGYVKGYLPGIRENGGQYTHAATWVVLATALMRRGRRALELFHLLNPIHHTTAREDLARYKVEPYVVVADVYGQPPHSGRGGWSWYTGSAAWLYRVGLENMLGVQRDGTRLRIDPCIPGEWKQYEITYRYGAAIYHIVVENPRGVEHGVESVRVDGKTSEAGTIDLVDDGRRHEVQVRMG